MATYKYKQDQSIKFQSNESNTFSIEKYDSKMFINFEKTLDEMVYNTDKIIEKTIIKYVPENEKDLVTYHFNPTTKNILSSNYLFLIASNNKIAKSIAEANPPPDKSEKSVLNVEKIQSLLKPVDNFKYIDALQRKNRIIIIRYRKLQKRITELMQQKNARQAYEEKKNTFNCVLRSIQAISISYTTVIFFIRIGLMANLSNPYMWTSVVQMVCSSPFHFQLFIDMSQYLQLFTPTEILTLKNLFQALQIDQKTKTLLKETNYIKSIIEHIFEKTADTTTPIPDDLGKGVETDDFDTTMQRLFNGHQKNSSLANFVTYIKKGLYAKNIFNTNVQFATGNDLFTSLYQFYYSPLGNLTLTTFKIYTDAYGYLKTNADFFNKYDKASKNLLFKGITLNSINSLSYNRYNQMFVQTVLQSLVSEEAYGGYKLNDLIGFEIPFIGTDKARDLFVTTIDQFVNVQIKSTIKGYFINLEKEAGYDVEAEKKRIKDEEGNQVDNIMNDLYKRGKYFIKHKKLGYTNDQITRMLDKPERTNNYKSFLFRYIKNFYNAFRDIYDDPLLLIDWFTNVTFIYNSLVQTFYPLLTGGVIHFYKMAVLKGWTHKVLLDLRWITFGFLSEITPIDLIISWIKLKYGVSDDLLLNKIEMGRIELINNVFSDLLTFCDELQSIFYDSTLGMSTNKYINYLNDSILGGLFKMSCSIGRFFLNYIYLPKARLEVLEFLPKINVPILEILSNKYKSIKLFAFIDNKMSNIMGALNKGELYKKLPQEFDEFTNISKIINGVVLPDLIADQYLSWKPRVSTIDGKTNNPFKGNIIKYVTPITDKTYSSKDKEEYQIMEKYTSDIATETAKNKTDETQNKDIISTNIIMGTNVEYNNYNVLNLEEIQNLLRKLANDSSVISNILKNGVKKEIKDNSVNLLYELYETDKQIYIPSKNMIYDINLNVYWDPLNSFKRTETKILDANGNTTYDEKNGQPVSKNIPELIKDPNMMSIIDDFNPDNFTYKYSNQEDIYQNTRESNILTDYSITNIFYYYYVNLFIKEKGSGYKFNIADFKNWLLKQTSIETNDTINDLDSTGIKVAIMNNILLSLDRRQKDQSTRFLFDNTQNQFELLPKMTIPEEGMNTLTKFIDDLSNGTYTDRSKSFVNDNFMLKTSQIDKSELIYRNAYMGVNLRHSYGYSSVLVKARDFLSTAELLLALNNGEANDEIKTLTDKLAEIENMSLNEPQIYFLLNDLNKLYSDPIQKISSNLNSIINDFKTNFCSEKDGQCDSENTIPLKHLLIDYPEFKTKFAEVLKSNPDNNYTTVLLEAYQNPYIVQYLKDNCEIKFKCNVQNKTTNVSETIYVNKNGINMDTGDMVEEKCLQTMKNSPVDFSKADDFLNILLRPEVFFQLSQYNKDEDAYIKNRKGIFYNSKINENKKKSERRSYQGGFTEFLRTIQNISQDGIKKEKGESNITTLFDIINEVIEKQRKEYAENPDNIYLDEAVQNVQNIMVNSTGDINFWEEVRKKLPQPTYSTETLEKMYYKNFKLKTLFKFGVILKDMKKRTIDPDVKNTLINYFSQKESILDKSAVFEEQINKVDNILQKIQQICENNKNAYIKTDLSADLKILKNLYDTDNIKGQINLTLNKTDNSRLDLSSFGFSTNNPYIENKKKGFLKFEEEFQTIRSKLIVLSGTYNDLFTESIICKKDDTVVNQYEILPVVKEYFDKRNDWIKTQNELFKLYILHTSNNYYSGFANNYEHLKMDINNVIANYSDSLDKLYLKMQAKKEIDKTLQTPQPITVEPAPEIRTTVDKPGVSEDKLVLSGIAAEQQKLADKDVADRNIQRQNVIDNTRESAVRTAETQATKEKTDIKQRTAEETKENTIEAADTAEKEKQKQSLGFGGSPDLPDVFGSLLNMLLNNLPSAVHTDIFETSTVSETSDVEKKKGLTNTLANCQAIANSWGISYKSSTNAMKYEPIFDNNISREEVNACMENNLLFTISSNINYLLVSAPKDIKSVVDKFSAANCGWRMTKYAYLFVKIAMGRPDAMKDAVETGVNVVLCGFIYAYKQYYEPYMVCFVYLIHNIMFKYFQNKIEQNTFGLDERMIFSFWLQMINTLSIAEDDYRQKSGGITRDNVSSKCSNLGEKIEISGLEKSVYDYIDQNSSTILKPNNNNTNPSMNNLIGAINIGQKEGDINFNDPAQFSKIITSILTDFTIEEYNEFVNNYDGTCEKFDENVHSLKMSIVSFIYNPLDNLLLKYFYCKVFHNPAPSITTMMYTFTEFLTNSDVFYGKLESILGDLFEVIFYNKDIRPFFLTRIFGNKSLGLNKNLMRDLMDESFEDFDNLDDDKKMKYLKKTMPSTIINFLSEIQDKLKKTMDKLESVKNFKLENLGFFENCKNTFCGINDVKKNTQEAIKEIEEKLFTISQPKYTFYKSGFTKNTYDKSDNYMYLFDDANNNVLDAILDDDNSADIERSFTLRDTDAVKNFDSVSKEKIKKNYLEQYKEILKVYKNTVKEYGNVQSVVFETYSNTSKNWDLISRVYDYIVNGKNPQFLNSYIIRACGLNNRLVIYTDPDNPNQKKFFCADLNLFTTKDQDVFKVALNTMETNFIKDLNVSIDKNNTKLNQFLKLLDDENIGQICEIDYMFATCDTKALKEFLKTSQDKLTDLLIKNADSNEIDIFMNTTLDELMKGGKYFVDTTKFKSLQEDINQRILSKEIEIDESNAKIEGFEKDLSDIAVDKVKNLTEQELANEKEELQNYKDTLVGYKNAQKNQEYFSSILEEIENIKNTPTPKNEKEVIETICLSKMASTENEEEFAFYYIKYFLQNKYKNTVGINENDLLFNLYALVEKSKTSEDLTTTINGNKIDFFVQDVNYAAINDKILSSGFKNKIVKNMQYLLLNKNTDYNFTTSVLNDKTTLKNDLSVRVSGTENLNVQNGYDIFKMFNHSAAYNKGIEENEKDLKTIDDKITANKNEFDEEEKQLGKINVKISENKASTAVKDLLDESYKQKNVLKKSKIELEKKSDLVKDLLVKSETNINEVKNYLDKIGNDLDSQRKKLWYQWRDRDILLYTQNDKKIEKNIDKDPDVIAYTKQLNKVSDEIRDLEFDLKAEKDESSKYVRSLRKVTPNPSAWTNEEKKKYETLELNIKNMNTQLTNKKSEYASKERERRSIANGIKIKEGHTDNPYIYWERVGRRTANYFESTMDNKLGDPRQEKTISDIKKIEAAQKEVKDYKKMLNLSSFSSCFDVLKTNTAYVLWSAYPDVFESDLIKTIQNDGCLSHILFEIDKDYNTITDELNGNKKVNKWSIFPNLEDKYFDNIVSKLKNARDNIRETYNEFYDEKFDGTPISNNLLQKANEYKSQIELTNKSVINYENAKNSLATDLKNLFNDIDTINKNRIIREDAIQKLERQFISDKKTRATQYKQLQKEINDLDKMEVKELKTAGYALKMTRESDMKIALFPSVEYDVDNVYIEKLADNVIPKEFSKNKLDNYSSDKISEGLIPPILYDVPSKWTVKTPVIKNNAEFNSVVDYKTVLSNSRISNFIQENYHPITSAADKQIWVLKMQITLWESTFENFKWADFSKKLVDSFSRKDNLADQVVKDQNKQSYIATQWTKDLVKKGFGIEVDYFNELKIKGIDEPSLNTIQALKTDNGKGSITPQNNYESDLLEILPINWLQENIQNTLFHFESDKTSTLFQFKGLTPIFV